MLGDWIGISLGKSVLDSGIGRSFGKSPSKGVMCVCSMGCETMGGDGESEVTPKPIRFESFGSGGDSKCQSFVFRKSEVGVKLLEERAKSFQVGGWMLARKSDMVVKLLSKTQ